MYSYKVRGEQEPAQNENDGQKCKYEGQKNIIKSVAEEKGRTERERESEDDDVE
jgi:hypothetical protein